ncbi:DUF6602 domain-containing protein [Methylophaga sp. OBS1]|uniref:DUF6602 domain-containing protein n=1 Tax=Methylophaga sp. OBS1 TaxID=2991933 RepID=UPI002256536D|nr:DUF6602 domain-containing protein [Methylophaga sp. OBS1]MCX4192814.1 hypothetical protein [Methylophaga sp. OBS1]
MTNNPAKRESMADGASFLRKAFAAEEQVLSLEISLAASSIPHSATAGSINERHFIDLLKRYLPKRYEVDSATVIDSEGKTSDQIDVVIFDNQYTPTLLDQKNHRFVPAEAVYAVLEVKPKIDKAYLKYAAGKAKSVRTLRRTSVPIRHAGGEYPSKAHFPIVAGIVAPTVDWRGGLDAKAFRSALEALKDKEAIDCGVGLISGAFDSFSGDLILKNGENSLIYFVFRLLQQLQSMGTVPAVDWNSYATVLSTSSS